MTRPIPKWTIVPVILLVVSSYAVYKLALSPAPAPTPVVASPPTIDMPAYVDARRPAKKFTGSAACGDCHDDELAGWKKSWHARALS
ncbi:MAG TPA: hypothetical protein VF403_14515, partial [Kofleriaceae bacterium]